MHERYPAIETAATLDAYDFHLPPRQIATHPRKQREAARLLFLPAKGGVVHTTFDSVGSYLRPGDLLIANNARVRPWRLEARREKTGGRVELLLLHAPRKGLVEALCRPARKVKPGETLCFGESLQATVLRQDEGRCTLKMAAKAFEQLERLGQMPLPPYVIAQRKKRGEAVDQPVDRERYQTVYATADGAVAAPTAGLHFTPSLVEFLREKKIEWRELTLLVGPGTFEPVKTPQIGEHRVEAESYSIPSDTWTAVERAKRDGRRIVAVGTTTCRALESAAGGISPCLAGAADLTIVPGHRFRVVDLLISNFHLPRSSLLLLVCALAGRRRILDAYGEAMAKGYRFYSYGDVTLLERAD